MSSDLSLLNVKSNTKAVPITIGKLLNRRGENYWLKKWKTWLTNLKTQLGYWMISFIPIANEFYWARRLASLPVNLIFNALDKTFGIFWSSCI